jgi:hypothetical protein
MVTMDYLALKVLADRHAILASMTSFTVHYSVPESRQSGSQ